MQSVFSTLLSEREELARLLQQRRQTPQRWREIDAEIRDRFSTTCAVVVLDMANFSRMTETDGIISTLQTIQTLRDIAVPLLENSRGKVLKVEADNLYAKFDTVDSALNASHRLMQRLNEVDIQVSMGIGYGEMLLLDDRELFGHEMNLASKLGEDLAQDNQILLTASARAALSATRWIFSSTSLEISDVRLTYFQLRKSA